MCVCEPGLGLTEGVSSAYIPLVAKLALQPPSLLQGRGSRSWQEREGGLAPTRLDSSSGAEQGSRVGWLLGWEQSSEVSVAHVLNLLSFFLTPLGLVLGEEVVEG